MAAGVKTFSEKLASLIAVDCPRFARIVETLQFGFLYAFLAILFGGLVDWMFLGMYPRRQDGVLPFSKVCIIVLVAAFQTAISAVSVIYLRKIGQLVPFAFPNCPGYQAHHHVNEYEGEIAIAFIFVGIQTNIVDQLSRVRKALNHKSDKPDN